MDEQFIAILGYEIMLASPLGHRNLLFPGLEGTLVMADYQSGSGGSFVGEQIEAYRKIWDPQIPQTATIAETLDALQTGEFLWTIHHCGDITEEERRHVTLYEACSEWGVSEECDRVNTSTTPLKDIFSRGFSPGLYGGSDDHRAKAGFMGHVAADGAPTPHPSGLTAVVCSSATRGHIYDALKNKHCYATTGARIILDPQVRRGAEGLRVILKIAAADVLDRAWVFKNGRQVYHTFFHTEDAGELAWEDTTFADGDNCYIRIRQTDGEIAWINPLGFADV